MRIRYKINKKKEETEFVSMQLFKFILNLTYTIASSFFKTFYFGSRTKNDLKVSFIFSLTKKKSKMYEY